MHEVSIGAAIAYYLLPSCLLLWVFWGIHRFGLGGSIARIGLLIWAFGMAVTKATESFSLALRESREAAGRQL